MSPFLGNSQTNNAPDCVSTLRLVVVIVDQNANTGDIG